MRKIVAAASITMGLFVSTLPADHLKDCLADMVHKKDTMPGMVDLSSLDRPAPQLNKSRPSNAVIAIVNGTKIRKKEADAYLKKVTKGKVSDFDLLPKAQRLRLVKDLALPIVMADAAKKDLSQKEKEGALVGMWMRKQASKVSVPDSEVKAFYDQLKQKAEQRNDPTKIIPPFDSIKHKMKSQMVEKKIMDGLMKNVEIEVSGAPVLPPMYLQQPVSNTIQGIK